MVAGTPGPSVERFKPEIDTEKYKLIRETTIMSSYDGYSIERKGHHMTVFQLLGKEVDLFFPIKTIKNGEWVAVLREIYVSNLWMYMNLTYEIYRRR